MNPAVTEVETQILFHFQNFTVCIPNAVMYNIIRKFEIDNIICQCMSRYVIIIPVKSRTLTRKCQIQNCYFAVLLMLILFNMRMRGTAWFELRSNLLFVRQEPISVMTGCIISQISFGDNSKGNTSRWHRSPSLTYELVIVDTEVLFIILRNVLTLAVFGYIYCNTQQKYT